jgi:hypothetical protein
LLFYLKHLYMFRAFLAHPQEILTAWLAVMVNESAVVSYGVR